MENKSAKYGLIGTIIAAMIAGFIALYIHNDTKSEQQKILELEKKANKSKNTANLNISDIFLPEINTKLESAFFIKITNDSLNDAKDLNVKINFGESEILKCETQPINMFEKNQDYTNSIISFDIKSINKNDKFYVYCLTSLPVFNSILITGSNLFQNEIYTYEQYKSKNDTISSGVTIFFKIIGAILFIIFTGYFTLVAIAFLNKKINLL